MKARLKRGRRCPLATPIKGLARSTVISGEWQNLPIGFGCYERTSRRCAIQLHLGLFESEFTQMRKHLSSCTKAITEFNGPQEIIGNISQNRRTFSQILELTIGTVIRGTDSYFTIIRIPHRVSRYASWRRRSAGYEECLNECKCRECISESVSKGRTNAVTTLVSVCFSRSCAMHTY